MASKMFRRKTALPKTPPSQLPRYTDPVALTLTGVPSPTVATYSAGKWSVQGDIESDRSAALQAEIDLLRAENAALRERNNMLTFKTELLVDMLTLDKLDAERNKSKVATLRRSLANSQMMASGTSQTPPPSPHITNNHDVQQLHNSVNKHHLRMSSVPPQKHY
ncbi:hypothetical protein Pelo_17166 [Pelomyxa schiedti]|nr:hypothetical protein Pelo_17166 [Pelomyxa schiedti]